MIESLHQNFLELDQRISTDTRNIIKDSIFWALKGSNFNGNLFAKEALEKGAKLAVVDEIFEADDRLILVDDVLKCLQNLSTYHRKFLKIPIIGIGGSNGKTSTKELLFSVFSKHTNCFCTQGNFNNHIGVPLTLLSLKKEHQLAIIELGANKIGDIEELCQISLPNFGVITNIGKEHLEGFGDIEGVAQAECELFDFLIKNNGHCFVNENDFWLQNMGKRIQNKTTFSIQNSGFEHVVLVPNISFEYKNLKFKSHLPGEHNLQNILATISIAEYFKIDLPIILEGISEYIPKNNRSQMIKTNKNLIFLDAYNANPSSVLMALKTFKEMNQKHQISILGDMFELGSYEHQEHQEIVDFCKNNLNFKQFIFVGKAFYKCQVNQENMFFFENKSNAIDFCKNQNIQDHFILLKGSRGMKIEEFKEIL